MSQGFRQHHVVSAVTANELTGDGEYDVCEDKDGFFVVGFDTIVGEQDTIEEAMATAQALADEYDRRTVRH